MISGLVADFGQIHAAAQRLESGANRLATITSEAETSWLGSAVVGAALSESTRVRHARAQAVAGQLAVKAAGAREAVADLVAVDSSAAQAVGAR
ncbi:hypothetical protein [uncultured Microbacterium sp.]|uniref:hypothetical protein n=1 Tax=uncultured Microbacterium sp. TaxID=191216 RepID=UPI00260150A3|nr:hypothetical protein [uncultured Microbacterium sp.]